MKIKKSNGSLRVGYFSSNSVLALQLKGFTLIELLVVISIIALLGSVVLVGLSSARAKSRDAKRVADMNQLAKAFEMYFNEYNSYPTAMDDTVLGATIPANLAKIVNKFPIAPKPADAPCVDGNPTTPAAALGVNAYFYQAANDGSKYTVTFCIGNSSPGGMSASTHFLTQGGFK